jgi:K(+)-stimulated pyrophosphate-energized sodium pump
MGVLAASAPYVGLFGLTTALSLRMWLGRATAGNQEMVTASASIRAAALSFLGRQYAVLSGIEIAIFSLLLLQGTDWIAYAFLGGAGTAMTVGLVALLTATTANVRSCEAARHQDDSGALLIAFNGGAVSGVTTASLGLLAIGALMTTVGEEAASQAVAAFALGACSAALLIRLSGGIHASVRATAPDSPTSNRAGTGAGEHGDPRDGPDPLHGTAGECVGQGVDAFGACCAAIGASVAIAATLGAAELGMLADGASRDVERVRHSLFAMPLGLFVIGLLTSLAGIYSMRVLTTIGARAAIRYSTLIAAGLFSLFSFMFVVGSPVGVNAWLAIIAGTIGGAAMGFFTERLVDRSADATISAGSMPGTAIAFVDGLAVGLGGAAIPLLVAGASTLVAGSVAGPYGVGMAAVGMLATVGIRATMDGLPAISYDAATIATRAGLGSAAAGTAVRLTAVGKTVAAGARGFAAASATVTALALTAAFGLAVEVNPERTGIATTETLWTTLSDGRVLAGLLLGSLAPLLLGSRVLRSISRATAAVRLELRRRLAQASMSSEVPTDPSVNDRAGAAAGCALREMAVSGIASLILPVAVGSALGTRALGAMLVGATLCGATLGPFFAYAGAGLAVSKPASGPATRASESSGPETEHATARGDAVASPLRDAASPAIGSLIRLLSVVALVVAPWLV